MSLLTKLANNGRPLLACYLPLGDPAVMDNLSDIYVESGVDIFEVGIPCEEPYLDGPVVSNSMARTIQVGVRQTDIGAMVAELKELYNKTAIVVMGYDNMCIPDLIQDGRAGFDGILKIGEKNGCCLEQFGGEKNMDDIDKICFVPYEMSKSDVERAGKAKGYIMLQASPGKTGIRDKLEDANREKIMALKQAGVEIPILLGIGISTPEQAARAIQLGADGVIMGSICLLKAEQGEEPLRELLTEVRRNMDAVQ